jgi:hypothetical protein
VGKRLYVEGIGMKAGRELDALIAEKVMGTNVFDFKGLPSYWDANIRRDIPHYSTNIADAWLVVEKLVKQCYQFGLANESDGKYFCSLFFDGAGTFEESAETAPLAICLAALKACGVEVEG